MDNAEQVEKIIALVKSIHDSLEEFVIDASNKHYSTPSILHAFSNFYSSGLPDLISDSHDALVFLDSLKEGLK